MKYDFRVVGEAPKPDRLGLQLLADGKARIEVRRRDAEIDLDQLTAS